MLTLTVGEPYPLPLAAREGAAAHFLGRSGSILQIVMPELQFSEIRALRKGDMRMGLLVDQPLILIVVEFRHKGEKPLIFECPLDARLLPRNELDLPSITQAEQRLLIEVHIVDSATGRVAGLRGITLAPGLTRDLYAAVQDQVARSDSDQEALSRYRHKSLEQLVRQANMLPCGRG